MSKSPRKVAVVALEVGTRALPLYWHRYSPKKFTQPQLFACLVLMRFFKADYRGIQALLEDLPSLREVLALKNDKVPHFTTLQQAQKRLLGSAKVRALLERSVELDEELRADEGGEKEGGEDDEVAGDIVSPPREVRIAAGDSTGLDASRRSKYYTRRRQQTSEGERAVMYTRFPKLGFICDAGRHLYLSVRATRGCSGGAGCGGVDAAADGPAQGGGGASLVVGRGV